LLKVLKMKNKELVAKVENITELTNSQKDRLNIQETAHENLCNFLNSHLHKLQSKNELISAIESKFLNSVMGKTDEEIPLIAVIKIYEILKRAETDADSAVLSLFNKNPDIFVNVNQNALDKDEPKLTKDEMNMAKDLLTAIHKLEKSEHSEK